MAVHDKDSHLQGRGTAAEDEIPKSPKGYSAQSTRANLPFLPVSAARRRVSKIMTASKPSDSNNKKLLPQTHTHTPVLWKNVKIG